MRQTKMFLCFTLTLISVTHGYVAKQKEVGVTTPLKDLGGSLPLNQHYKLEAFVSEDQVVLSQGSNDSPSPSKTSPKFPMATMFTVVSVPP